MRIAQIGLVAALLAFGTMLVQERSAFAAFHCMRVHAVMAGFNTNNTIQYVELRMNAGGQTAVGGHQIRFYDAVGTHMYTFTIPSSISNGFTGDSILIGTSEFNTNTLGGDADFTFTTGMGGNTVAVGGSDPTHPVQSTGGRIEFAPGFDNCDADFTASPGEVDTVGYGGGSTPYGSSAVSLPSPSDNRALRLSNLAIEATNNSAEYSLQAVSATTFSVGAGSLATDFTTPRNNGRTVLQLGLPTPTPTPTLTPTPIPVGGVVEVPGIGANPAGASGRSNGGWAATEWVALSLAGAAAALGMGVWYARKRQAP